MKPCSLIFAAILLSSVVALPQGQTGLHGVANATTEEEIKEGVIVDQVAKNSQAEKAGLRQGDIILRWTSGHASGKLESPFDLSWTEMEQGPRGPIALEGLRNGQILSWNLGAGDWGVTSQPNLQGTLLSIYRKGQELAKAGKWSEAVERWQAGAAQVQQSQVAWLSSWFLFHSAEILAAAHQWKEADSAYQKAVDSAATPTAAAQVLRRRGRVFQQQNDWNAAEKYYRQALAEAGKLGSEGLFIARCLHQLAGLFVRRGDLNKAQEQYFKVLAMQQKIAPESLDVAATLDSLALVAEQKGDLTKAEEYGRKELAIAERLAPDSMDFAIDLNNVGYTVLRKGDFDAAAAFFQRALVLEEKLEPDQMATASTLTNLGDISWQQGNLGKAEEYHRRSLAIREKVAPAGMEHSAGLNNLGLIYTDRGDLVEGEKLYLQAVLILEKIAPDSFEMSVSWTNLGALNWFRGDLETADEYYRRALAIADKIGPDSMHAAGLLGNLGTVAQERHSLAKAQEYFLRALSIHEKRTSNSLDTAFALNNLGGLAQQQKNDKQAREYYERALQMEEKVAPRSPQTAVSLSHLGDLAGNENDLAKAESYCRRALAIRESFSSRNTDYAETLASLASLLHRKGQTEEAAQLFAQTLDVLENQIAVLGGGEEISSNFRAKHVDYYKEYADLLVQQKQPELAFQVIERLRARELLKVLAAHIDISKGEGSSLLAQQRALAGDLAAKGSRRIKLLSDEHTEEQALDKEIRVLGAQLESVNAQIRKSNPDYAALAQPQPLSVKEVQKNLLDADTVLLEYGLGEERSYVWLVASDSAAAYELPKREQIEAAARKLRDTLTARNGDSKGETDVGRLARAKKADAEYPQAAAELSRMILAPVASRIGHKRLLVVSDGILQYMPFAVLPAPGDTGVGGPASWPPLIRDHEVVNLPSASVLSLLKRQLTGRAPAAKIIAVLADPVFDGKDARIRSAPTSSQEPTVVRAARRAQEGVPLSGRLSKSLMLRSASEIGMINGEVPFPRLFFARAEAEAILQDIPIEERLKALDFKASRATAMSQELSKYRIVHFATHGLLNSEHPELSGLVLSLVDEQGQQQNGFLSLNDIYNLKLRADLVVLSACETGLGREIQGEGVVGIARGFMYAGASSVVASLWKVDDLATAEFMKIFYKGMLNDKLRPATALRAAQVAMSKRRQSPYFWAGFVLQGAQ